MDNARNLYAVGSDTIVDYVFADRKTQHRCRNSGSFAPNVRKLREKAARLMKFYQ